MGEILGIFGDVQMTSGQELALTCPSGEVTKFNGMKIQFVAQIWITVKLILSGETSKLMTIGNKFQYFC